MNNRERVLWWAVLAALASIFLRPITPPEPPLPVDSDCAWVIVVEQTEERSVDLAKVIASGYLDTLAPDTRYRVYDYDSDEATPFKPAADKAGLPAMIFLNESGRIVYQGKFDPDVLRERLQ